MRTQTDVEYRIITLNVNELEVNPVNPDSGRLLHRSMQPTVESVVTSFGGHKAAAGVTCIWSNLQMFETQINAYAYFWAITSAQQWLHLPRSISTCRAPSYFCTRTRPHLTKVLYALPFSDFMSVPENLRESLESCFSEEVWEISWLPTEWAFVPSDRYYGTDGFPVSRKPKTVSHKRSVRVPPVAISLTLTHVSHALRHN
ncbi:hypothetical protein EDD16DRAFT_1555381 [Pisolithus croceorrhizus]|nr:hypothetical protein EV401DRAFT_1506347 [Pisolithus croceorrhizus]KAI6126113.1 hypothetical protein EDD16DRAFT_1555381 [Pisolithus croceorrhizus]